jgi:glycosyltransferase involved in cell wall biosynthesis
MSDQPLVSCVVPVFNGEKYLAEAIGSVLAQTYSPIEIIVVDDGSTDSSPEILARFAGDVTIVRQQNAGPAAARNRGIANAKGEYVAFLDADDTWVATKTATQMRHFADVPGLGVSTALMQNFWTEEMREEAARAEGTDLAKPQPGPSQTILARRAAFDRAGSFDPRLSHRDTQDWIVRARAAGVRIEQLDEVLVRRRLHATNLSRSRGTQDAEELFAIIHKKLARAARPNH